MKNTTWLAVTAYTIGLAAFTMPISTFAAETPYNPDVEKAYLKAKPLIEKAVETKADADIKAAIDAFVDISNVTQLSDSQKYTPNNPIDVLFNSLYHLTYDLPNDRKERWVAYMAYELVEHVRFKDTHIFFAYAEKYTWQPKGALSATLKRKLELEQEALSKYVVMQYGFGDEHPPLSRDKTVAEDVQKVLEDMKKDPNNPYTSDGAADPTGPNYFQEYFEEKQKNPPKIVVPSTSDSSQTVTQLVQEGDKWYEYTIIYKDGVKISTEKKLVDSSHPVAQELQLEVQENVDTTKESTVPTVTRPTNAYPTDLAYFLSTQNPHSNKSVQYSVDNKQYYYESSIRADDKGAISYDQMTDLFRQIAQVLGGIMYEDTNALFFIIDGKTYFFETEQTTFSVDSLNTILPVASLDIRVDLTRVGATTFLSTYDVNQVAKSFYIYGLKQDLPHVSEIKGTYRTYAARDFILPLQGTIIQEGDNWRLNVLQTNILVTPKNAALQLDGQTYIFKGAIYVKEGVLYVPIRELFDVLGLPLVFDSASESLRLQIND